MLLKLLLLFILVPLAELTLLLLLGDYTHWWVPLLLVVVTGVMGAVLARHQGWRTLRRIRQELREGHLPGDAMLDAAMILVAGALLLTPGMITDVAGITLLIPPCRRLYKTWLVAWFKRRFKLTEFEQQSGRTEIIDSYVVDTREEGNEGRKNGETEG